MTTPKSVDSPALDRLHALSEAAKLARLSPAEEDEAVGLLGVALNAGKAGILAAAEIALLLPWGAAVRGVTLAWPELKPVARKQFTVAIGAQKTEGGRRCRLSLARGLTGVDGEAVARLAGAACAEMLAENNPLTARDRQMFFNVFIGKGKPWLTHFTSLEEWKPKDREALVGSALQTCFDGPCPPFTQVALLRWIASVGGLAKLSPESLESVAKAVKRWVPKFQKELASAVPDLPEQWSEILKSTPAPPVETPPEKPAPQRPSRREEPAPRPAARTASRGNAQDFNLQNMLRQISDHVDSLQKELHEVRNSQRREDQDKSRRGGSRSRDRDADQTPLTPEDHEALVRHNARLEESVAELRQQLEEVAMHHEDVAASRDAAAGNNDAGAEIKALLGLKLRNDFAEFHALRGESGTEVLRQHFREMLSHVFSVLQSEGVMLTEPPQE